MEDMMRRNESVADTLASSARVAEKKPRRQVQCETLRDIAEGIEESIQGRLDENDGWEVHSYTVTADGMCHALMVRYDG